MQDVCVSYTGLGLGIRDEGLGLGTFMLGLMQDPCVSEAAQGFSKAELSTGMCLLSFM